MVEVIKSGGRNWGEERRIQVGNLEERDRLEDPDVDESKY
jgi:hypothetical protein